MMMMKSSSVERDEFSVVAWRLTGIQHIPLMTTMSQHIQSIAEFRKAYLKKKAHLFWAVDMNDTSNQAEKIIIFVKVKKSIFDWWMIKWVKWGVWA